MGIPVSRVAERQRRRLPVAGARRYPVIMKTYDALVVGSGCGMSVVEAALTHGWKVALVDKGPYGGTCLNVGCIPSKMLIVPADRVTEIVEAKKLGIQAQITSIDFSAIMERMRRTVRESQQHMRRALSQVEGLDFYEGEGRFVADYTMEVNGQQIKGKRIFLASGSRPTIPPIKGLESVSYLTSDTLLALTERPESLIIIGGGYIAVEYGHFFAAMGTRVTILEMADRLVLNEEPEIALVLQRELSKRMEVHTGTLVQEIKGMGKGVMTIARDKASGKDREFTAEQILVAVGRRSNADLLDVAKTGVELDQKGFIKVNDYLQTNKAKIYAMGDANGRYMFTHVANREASVVVENALHDRKEKMDYDAIPHAVYTHPQIAGVGLTEQGAREKFDVAVGRAAYTDVARGDAMMEEVGFAKAIIDRESGRILGFHIIGPEAPELIQEVVNAMASGGGVAEIGRGIHIHPALSELIVATLGNLEDA